jgi:hypothetical protein
MSFTDLQIVTSGNLDLLKVRTPRDAVGPQQVTRISIPDVTREALDTSQALEWECFKIYLGYRRYVFTTINDVPKNY